MKRVSCALGVLLLVLGMAIEGPSLAAAPGDIVTIAGNGMKSFGGDGGPATLAKMYWPMGVAADSAGNVYIADSVNHRLRRIDAVTGIITTAVGGGASLGDGGPASQASLLSPSDVFIDPQDNIYIADRDHRRIRRVDAATGIITTVAGKGQTGFGGDGGPATEALFNDPYGIFVDGSNNLYIADMGNTRVRKVDAATGIINTIAGSDDCSKWCPGGYGGDGGPAVDARLRNPWDVVVNSTGDVFIADRANSRVRKIDGATGIISTYAGTGVFGQSGDGGRATSAQLSFPTGLALDADENLFIADSYAQRVRKVEVLTQRITTVAGSGPIGAYGTFSGDGGPATSARMNNPANVFVNPRGDILIADMYNERIRKVFGPTPPQVVDENGGAVISADGVVTVTIPPGALAGPTSFYITVNADLTAANEDSIIIGGQQVKSGKYRNLSDAYFLEPHGLQFLTPVTLTFQMQQSPGAYVPDIYKLFGSSWEPLGGVEAGGALSVQIGGFSNYTSVAVEPDPIPTLSEWAMIIMVGLLASVGSLALNRRLKRRLA